jgi:hypothetical protein
LHKNILDHFDARNPEHPFLNILSCKKDCYNKAFRHHINMTAKPEEWNSPWNCDDIGKLIMTQTIQKIFVLPPGLNIGATSYNKFHSLPSGKTNKVAVYEKVSFFKRKQTKPCRFVNPLLSN